MTKKKTKDNSYSIFRQQLKAGQIQRLYVFHGEEQYLLEHAVTELTKRLVPQGMEEFNLRLLDAKSTLSMLAEAIDSPPMLSERSLTLVRDFDLFGLKDSQAEEMEAILSDLPDYATVVFIFDTLEYSPDGRKKLTKKVKEIAQVVNFCRQEKNDLVRWLKTRFNALSKQISDQDAEYLIFLAGDLMSSLIGETEKLAAYARGETITKADIDQVVVPVVEAVIFSLGDALATGDYSAAMRILGELLDTKEKPEVLIALIGRQMRQLYHARLVSGRRDAVERVMEQWNMNKQYPAELLIKNAAKVSLEWCRRAVLLCAEADMDIKSFTTDKRLTMELLVLRMALL